MSPAKIPARTGNDLIGRLQDDKVGLVRRRLPWAAVAAWCYRNRGIRTRGGAL